MTTSILAKVMTYSYGQATDANAGRFASYVKNPSKRLPTMSAGIQQDPSQLRPVHKLKLGLWNVRSMGSDEKLLSTIEDATIRHLNISVLTGTRQSEKNV